MMNQFLNKMANCTDYSLSNAIKYPSQGIEIFYIKSIFDNQADKKLFVYQKLVNLFLNHIHH